MHRLKEALIPYQFDIEYRKGQDQEAADCLSRNPVDEISGEIVNFVNKDPTTIANEQKDDPQYLLIKQRLRLRRKLDSSSHINRFIEKTPRENVLRRRPSFVAHGKRNQIDVCTGMISIEIIDGMPRFRHWRTSRPYQDAQTNFKAVLVDRDDERLQRTRSRMRNLPTSKQPE